MAKVIGEFTATVPKPVTAGTNIINALNGHNRSPDARTLNINGAQVLVRLGGLTEPDLESGEYPRVKSFRVHITRDVALQSDEGQEALTRNDEQEFEKILIKAVRIIVSAIKKETEQWFIDTRRPVQGYRCSYRANDGTVIKDEFPREPESYKMPSYALHSLAGVFTPFMPIGELDMAMWADLQGEVNAPIDLPLYDELIYDAAVLQAAKNYEMAALSAAIAIEVMLRRVCLALWRRQGKRKKRAGGDISKVVKKIKELEPGFRICDDKINRVFRERDRIAHGESRSIDPRTDG